MSALERAIREAWRAVLGDAGPDDHFTQAGGTSLHAIQLASLLSESLGIEVPLLAALDHPTPARLAAALAGAGPPAPEPAGAAPDGRALPLSFPQARLWFLSQLEPGSAAYNAPAAWWLTGELDTDALRRAVARLIERHEALRTRLVLAGEEPVQWIDPPGDQPDLEALAAAGGDRDERRREALRIGTERAALPFSLGVDRLVRPWLVRASSDEHLLVLGLHHAVCDGPSRAVLARDLAALYAGELGLTAPPDPPALGYGDFTAWQLGRDDGHRDGLAHWRRALEGLSDDLPMLPDGPQPLRPSARGARHPLAFDADLLARLRTVCAAHDATPFMGLLASFAALLHRWGGREDMAIGVPVLGRPAAGYADVVGHFVNTLVLRVRPAAELGFAALLAQVRRTALDAYAHQEVPFERLVQELRPERSQGRSPLFEVLFSLQPAGPTVAAAGLRMAPVELDPGTAKADLSVWLQEDGRVAAGRLEHRADVLTAATAGRLVAQWQRLLRAVVADPDVRVGDVDLLSEADRDRVRAWGRRGPEAAGDAEGAAAQFEARVRRDAGAVALRAGGSALRMGELNASANRLARLLRRRGAGPERLVGLALGRTPEHVVGVLAALKAGAAFLPLDAGSPPARLRRMLEEARPAVLLTSRALAGGLPEVAGVDRVLVDGDRTAQELAALDDGNLEAGVRDANPAYVIYTSGSTGAPKGVVVTHGALGNQLRWLREAYPEAAAGRTLGRTPAGFDASVWETLLPLVGGGELVLSAAEGRDARGLLDEVRRERVGGLQVVPSLLRALVAELEPGDGPDLAWLFAGGEELDRGLCEEVWDRLGDGVRIVNLYGPTETCIQVLSHEVRRGEPGRVPVGTPVRATRVHVLDRRLRPVAPGVVGEVYVGGAGLARGYLGQPALTAERFVADPHGPAGARLYRTGDLGRWRDGGVLEHAGRADRQVKVRGHRVELDEVEAALAAGEGVAGAAVVLREDGGAPARLVGYVERAPDAGPLDLGRLRERLRERLPGPMLPALLVELDRLPRTAGGKLDRRSLPGPAAEPTRPARAPRGPEEEALRELFADLLGRPTVGVDDDFFALGGHSLLATRLAGRIRRTLGVEVPIGALFATPTVAALAAHVRGAGRGRAALLPAGRPARLPLSPAQRRLWFLARLEGAGPTYNIPLAIRLRGALDAAALAAALRDVVLRHESLRTVLPEVDGEPWQVVRGPEEVGDLLEVREVAAAELPGAMAAAAGHPFDLGRDAPLHARLLVAGPDDAVLVLVLHHVAADGWSLPPLARDLAAAYAARRAGRPPGWAPLPVQYADYTLWQRRRLEGEGELARQLVHWRTALAGLPEELPLPADHPRRPLVVHRGGQVRLRIERELHARVAALAGRCHVTVFMVLQAALAVLLSRLGAGHDVPIASPIAGRMDPALDDLVGFFVNTLVLRVDTSGDPSFGELLARVRELDLAAYANQEVPFEHLVEVLNPARSLRRHPLFQVMLAFSSGPPLALELPGLDVAVETLPVATAKMDLSVVLRERRAADGAPAGIEGELQYSAALFEPETAAAMAARLLRVLEEVTAAPDRTIGRVDVLLPGERERELAAGSGTGRRFERETLTDLFRAQVERTPDAVAVVSGEARLTYAELDRRARGLAGRLVALGVGPDVTVGLCVGRSPDMVVGLLGVLLAGGAYVPLDPEYPAERLALMLADAAVRVLVTEEAVRGRLPAPGCPVLPLEDIQAGGAPAATPCPVPPDALAYVVYTSGSTGRPKGVALSHRALANLVQWHLETLLPAAATLQFSSLSFDASCHEVFAALASGGTLHVVDDETRRDGRRLAAFLAEHAIAKANLPAAALQQLAEQEAPPAPALREVVSTAEQLQVTPGVRRLLAGPPGGRLHNHYGPSETHVATAFALPGPPAGWEALPPIGRPVANCAAHVLDRRCRPLPAGVPGELYLGGVQLARGYLGRPAQTAERFVASPFGPPGARLYRTGDLARRRRDGNLEYLGRADAQLKVRGHRVEPGEVEMALREVPGVEEAVVTAWGDGLERRLVAHVVPGPAFGGAGQVRARLRARLPDHLVPGALVVHDALPLTPSGKLDRRALAVPGPVEAAAGRAPEGPAEEILCGLFAQVLDVPAVGPDDGFFELGGHSLLATRLLNRVRASLGADLPLRSVFEAPTPAGLAALLPRAQPGGRPPLRPRPRPDPIPLSAGQRRLWYLAQVEGPSATYHLPFALRLRGELDPEALAAAIGDVVARHESLRTVLVRRAGRPGQVVLDPDAAGVRLERTGATEDGLPAALVEAASRPFDLAREAPFRPTLLAIAPRDHVLLLLLHHVAADGWSQGPLARDLAAAYAARRAGRPPGWAPLPVQYADFALWQREVLGEPGDPDSLIATQLRHWRAALAGLPAAIALPADRPRPPRPSARGGWVRCRLAADLQEALTGLARANGVTLFMVLQSALAALLGRLGAGPDVPIGCPVSGREDEALQDLVGYFSNTLVLRADLSGRPGFDELLARVRAFDLAAYEHQDVPFEHVVEAVGAPRSAAHHPLFQVGFAFQGGPEAAFALEGLDVEPLRVERGTSPFDLSLTLAERRTEAGSPDGIAGLLAYRADLFDRATVDGLWERYRRLLEAVAADPSATAYS